MEKHMHVFTASLVFLNKATLTKHGILRYESYFFIFCVFDFFSENVEKWLQNSRHIFTLKKY